MRVYSESVTGNRENPPFLLLLQEHPSECGKLRGKKEEGEKGGSSQKENEEPSAMRRANLQLFRRAFFHFQREKCHNPVRISFVPFLALVSNFNCFPFSSIGRCQFQLFTAFFTQSDLLRRGAGGMQRNEGAKERNQSVSLSGEAFPSHFCLPHTFLVFVWAWPLPSGEKGLKNARASSPD